MSPDNMNNSEIFQADGGKVVFAPDVIATIASLAVADVEGVASMNGTVVDGLSGMLGKKSYTKGVKVEIIDDTVTAELSIVAKYGFKIHEVCKQVQQAVKNAIETMTGLKVTAVNVNVQAVAFDKPEKPEKPEKAEKKEKEKETEGEE